MANIKHGTAVSIAEPESISPQSSPRLDGKASLHSLGHMKQHYATGAKRLLGRPAPNASSSSLQTPTSTGSFTAAPDSDSRAPDDDKFGGHRPNLRHHTHQHHSGHGIPQVSEWLQREKAKKARRKSKRQVIRSKIISATDNLRPSLGDGRNDATDHREVGRERADSDVSDSSVDLESLEKILKLGEDANTTPKDERRRSSSSRRLSAKPKLLQKNSGLASSDTDYLDGDAVIPSADVVLDNSKTLGYSGGEADSQTNVLDSRKRGLKEKEAWLHFKKEIVRLAHTLRLKGWRRVPLDRGGEIVVERLSGALTNAVYVVSPPADLSSTPSSRNGSAASYTSEKAPLPPP